MGSATRVASDGGTNQMRGAGCPFNSRSPSYTSSGDADVSVTTNTAFPTSGIRLLGRQSQSREFGSPPDVESRVIPPRCELTTKIEGSTDVQQLYI